MKINIICSEASSGWIYSDFIYNFKKYSKHTILVNEKNPSLYDVVYFIPYYEYFAGTKPSAAWLSHMEQKEPLRSRFVNVAKSVTIGISQSKKYYNILKNEYQCHNIQNIITGVDTSLFTQRSPATTIGSKLIVGYVGRQYSSSNRKNPTLLNKISKLPFVDFRVTGGKLKSIEVPRFIQGCNLIVSPSICEGGPMSIQQSLATGTPILCYDGVGLANEFGTGVIRIPFNDSDAFVSCLETLWKTKSYLEWNDIGRINELRAQVLDQTWENFVKKHDAVFDSLVAKQ